MRLNPVVKNNVILNKSIVVLVTLLWGVLVHAHHSFAAFDIDQKIERTGVITVYEFKQPHIMMEIEVTLEDSSKELWEIESLVPRRWTRNGYDKEFVKLGDIATIVGFPARNGSTKMMLSAIRTDKGELVVRDKINQ